MSELLVVRLRPTGTSEVSLEGHVDTAAPPQEAEWIIVDAGGAPRSAPQVGRLSDAAALTPSRRVVVLTPGADVLLAEPVVPLRGGAKLAQIVPFALEEQLASDVDDLHFAVGKPGGERPGTPVRIVSHERMNEWRAALAAAGLRADAMYAETDVLPHTPSGVTVLIDGLRVYVRRADEPPAVLEVEPLIEALQLALASHEPHREHATIYVGESDYERDRDLLEGLREFTASLQLKLLPQGPLPLLAAHVAQGKAVNLLQGPYLARSRLNVSFAPWRHAAALALVFAALHLGSMSWRYVQDRQTEARLDTEIAEIYQQLMPGAPVPAAAQARRQVEARLAQLRGGGGAQGMMTTLAALGEAMSQTPGTNIEALSYRNDITDLRVLAPSVDALDRIRQVAGERGISARIESAHPRDSKFEGRLQLRNPGA